MHSLRSAPVRVNPPSPSWRLPRASLVALVALSLSLVAGCGGGGNAEGPAATCSARSNADVDDLLACVTVEAVQAHIETLADIALANGGSRAAGTAGYDASAAHVADLLREAGYAVTVQRFSYETYVVDRSALEQRTPSPATLAHEVLEFSGNADVTARVAAPAGETGCAASDFARFPAGSIALVRRGGCAFTQKAGLAARAGAAALVVENLDDAPMDGALGEDFAVPLAVVGVSRTVGVALRNQVDSGVTLHLQVRSTRALVRTANVLAETAAGDPSTVVIAGAHLDTVKGTAGANDNASGAAALLETALQMARVPPRNKVRFAFWAGEEDGLKGSTTYVDRLSGSELARIAVYLNFDMIASPNHVFGVFTGNGEAEDGSQLPGGAAAAIQKVFSDHYERLGVPWKPVDGADGRSDHVPFAEAGIPHGGLYTGAEEIKTPAEAAIWGGTAGAALDPCYHLRCDGLANLNLAALAVNADLVAAAVLHFGMHVPGR